MSQDKENNRATTMRIYHSIKLRSVIDPLMLHLRHFNLHMWLMFESCTVRAVVGFGGDIPRMSE
jgi:hypothetical protein